MIGEKPDGMSAGSYRRLGRKWIARLGSMEA
jgi:hypothetical protein